MTTLNELKAELSTSKLNVIEVVSSYIEWRDEEEFNLMIEASVQYHALHDKLRKVEACTEIAGN